MPVFSLEEARALQIKNISQNTFKYWSESAVYGYYVGGYFPPSAPPPPYPPSGVSLISRLDFSNETVSNPGKNLSTGRGALAAVSNNSYGYFGGGYASVYLGPTTNYCTISRLDFSNETVSDPGKNLPTTNNALAATSSSSYGYFVGGYSGSFISTISRLDFSNETVSNPGKTLPFARSSIGAVSNNSYGYFAGGFYTPIPSYYSCVISRLDFSSETTSDPGKNLSQIRNNYTATSSNSYGYFVGGYSFPPLPPASLTPTSGALSTITRLDFSNETVSDPGKNLPQVTQASTAATSSSSYGYFGGGTVAGSIANTISRLDFSNETASAPGNNLPSVRSILAAVSGGASVYRGSKTYGYFAGGDAFPSKISTISRLDFSSEIVSDPGKNLPVGRIFLAATSSNFYGYFGGGLIGNVFPSHISTITRLDFSNETVSNPGKNLPTARERLAAVSSGSYGYFGGGASALSFPGFWESTISRLDFSNESISNPGKNLYSLSSLGVSDLAVISSNSYGYFGGGYYYDPSSELSDTYNTIVRLDFSNETISLPGKNLPSNRYGAEGVSNNFYGYFAGGGSPSINTITRLDFSNETVSNPSKNLPTTRIYFAATSSSYYGYFGGDSTTLNNTISRLDFSNETVSNPGKNFLTSRGSFAAVSNSN